MGSQGVNQLVNGGVMLLGDNCDFGHDSQNGREAECGLAEPRGWAWGCILQEWKYQA